MTQFQKGNRGFIKSVFLIVVGLIVLGFFGYNLKEVIDSPTVNKNLVYVWSLVVAVWNTCIVEPSVWLWQKIQSVFF